MDAHSKGGECMKGLICYFSTTGNTKLACEHINSKVNNIEFDYYDITSPEEPNFSDYELIGFATYTDFLEPGKLMVKYMKSIEGKGKPAFVFNTYGQMSGNTLASMAKHVKASGTTNENYPMEKDLTRFNDFMTNLNSVAEQLNTGKTVPEKNVKRNIFTSVVRTIMGSMNVDKMGEKKVHKDQCISCSVCFNVCPYGVIEMSEGYPVFNESKCESCFACFNKCPTKSIYTKKIDGIGHYSKPHEKLVEKMK